MQLDSYRATMKVKYRPGLSNTAADALSCRSAISVGNIIAVIEIDDLVNGDLPDFIPDTSI